MTRREKARLEQEIFKGDVAHVERGVQQEAAAGKTAADANAKATATTPAAAKAAAAAASEPEDGDAKPTRAPAHAADDDDGVMWQPPPHCVPICGDVRSIDFDALCRAQLEARGRLFDVITMDPPWQLASANPTRGVALGYSQLGDSLIEQIPVAKLQTDGFLFMWVINAKYKMALGLLKAWGYDFVDELTWVKQTVNHRVAKSHGFYLQHAKETCFVGRKGKAPPGCQGNIGSDVIWSLRRGQSQKPEEQYELMEELVPNGSYLEIFGRRNNLRNGWVTIGNEL
jgi:mRNA (2'-O-methyladenosine-N6-)-methyltransferase